MTTDDEDGFQLVPRELAAFVVQVAATILGAWCLAVIVMGLQ